MRHTSSAPLPVGERLGVYASTLAGEEAAPDVHVSGVHPTHILLDRGGRLETVELPRSRK
jgi:hypothetical protein